MSHADFRSIPLLLAGILGCLCAPVVSANAPVEVVALFKDRAVIRSASGETMFKVGQTKDGLRLISADPYGAKVEFGGQIFNLNLSSRVAASFMKPEQASVRLNRDPLGQYRVRGTINASPVNFLVDTGASVVAMSERHAQSVGLSYTEGRQGKVQTAQGLADAYYTDLNQINVGGIVLNNVKATVITGDYPTDVLLGMSFLNEVSMHDTEGVLTLTARY
ncbi:MAG: retropepsin-like aspartic protease [Pseudomonadota bacterium]